MAAAAEPSHNEPDLTAMLDLVLQLVMFFLLVAHIDREQKDENVTLPSATMARALNKDLSRVLLINVVPENVVAKKTGADADQPDKAKSKRAMYSVFGGVGFKEFTSTQQLQTELQNQIERDKKNTTEAEWAKGQGRSVIVIRGDQDCKFEQVYGVMRTCRAVGYSEVQLRALIK